MCNRTYSCMGGTYWKSCGDTNQCKLLLSVVNYKSVVNQSLYGGLATLKQGYVLSQNVWFTARASFKLNND